MFTDADYEAAALAEAGNNIARGICPGCEDPLSDTLYGPAENVAPGWHDSCARGDDDW